MSLEPRHSTCNGIGRGTKKRKPSGGPRVILAVDSIECASRDDIRRFSGLRLLAAALPVLLALAPVDARPVVHVDTGVLESPDLADEARRLRGTLVARLVEEGYVIAPLAADAHIRMTVRPSENGWVVETAGEEKRAYRIAPGPLPVVALEILHRAVIAIENSRGPRPHPPSTHGRAVALAISADANDVLSHRLQEEVALHLSDAGMFLVPLSRPHDRIVCVSIQPTIVTIASGQTADKCSLPAVEISRDDQSNDGVVDQVGRNAAKLVRAADSDRTDSGEGPAAPSAAPIDDLTRSSPSASPRSAISASAKPERPWTLRFGANGGALVRAGGTDPLLSIKTEVFVPSGLGARLQGGFAWSNGTPPLSIAEWQVQSGPAFKAPIGRSASFVVGLLGGILVHRYHFHTTDNGSRVDWNFSLPLELSYRLGALPGLGLTIMPGVAGPPRDHEIDGNPAWQRGIYYLAVMAGTGVSL